MPKRNPRKKGGAKPGEHSGQSGLSIFIAQQRTIDELREYAANLEERNTKLESDFQEISNAYFWRLTGPARHFLIAFRKAFGIQRKKRKAPADPHALLMESFSDTGTKLFSRKELENQRRAFSLRTHGLRGLIFPSSEAGSPDPFQKHVLISLVVPLYNTPAVFLREMIRSVQHQTYPFWELCLVDASDQDHPEVERICRRLSGKDHRIKYRRLKKNGGISANSNVGLENSGGEYIALLDHDDILHPAALYEAVNAIVKHHADFIYTDEAIFTGTPENAHVLHFKPDYAPDTLLVNNYICHFTIFRKDLLKDAGSFDSSCDGSQDHDLFLRLTEKAKVIVHVPEILYYWRSHSGSTASNPMVKPETISSGVLSATKKLQRSGWPGAVHPINPGATIYHVQYEIKGTPTVSILIWEYESLTNLSICLQSILDKTFYPHFEILISVPEKQLNTLSEHFSEAYISRHSIRFIPEQSDLTASERINALSARATGDMLLFLSGNTAVISRDWLNEMIGHAQRDHIGAVGAKMYKIDNTIHHAGFHLREQGLIASRFEGVEQTNAGYMGRLMYAQNVIAVSADCMMTRRDVFSRTEGMDPLLTAAERDADYCLRLKNLGYYVLWTPYATLYCYRDETSETRDQSPDPQLFRRRWESEIISGDPYSNPNFDQSRDDCFMNPIRSRYAPRY